MTSSIQEKVQVVNQALHHVRSALETNNLDTLPQALTQAQAAVDSLNAYPGGAEQLRSDIDQLPAAERDQVRQWLDEASVHQQVNGQLIKLAMQKNAALQAYIAQESDAATYSNTGLTTANRGEVLSRKV